MDRLAGEGGQKHPLVQQKEATKSSVVAHSLIGSFKKRRKFNDSSRYFADGPNSDGFRGIFFVGDWIKLRDDRSRAFFWYNELLDKSEWKLPPEAFDKKKTLPKGWIVRFSPKHNNRLYFWNEITLQSSWSLPYLDLSKSHRRSYRKRQNRHQYKQELSENHVVPPPTTSQDESLKGAVAAEVSTAIEGQSISASKKGTTPSSKKVEKKLVRNYAGLPPLPADWKELFHIPTGRYYYVNLKTKKKQWHFPGAEEVLYQRIHEQRQLHPLEEMKLA